MSNDLDRPGDDGHPLGLPYYGCPMGDAVIRFLKNYARFSGRASRSEFWWAVLVTVITSAIFGMLSKRFLGIVGDVFFVLFVVFQLLIIVPNLALMTRRVHDSNLSGWWVFGYCALNVLAVSFLAPIYMQLIIPISINLVGTMMYMSLLLSLITFVLFLVIMLRKPRPEGVRFDKRTIPTPPMGPGSSNGTRTGSRTSLTD